MIIISPWSRKTTEGQSSPKNYPYWEEVVKGLGSNVHQLSLPGEPDVRGCNTRSDGLSLTALRDHILNCEVWMSVDNFMQHFAWSLGKPGIVIWGPSDPIIFGHPENINLIKDRKYLRSRQFGLWSQAQIDPSCFVSPSVVIDNVSKLQKQAIKPANNQPIYGQWRP